MLTWLAKLDAPLLAKLTLGLGVAVVVLLPLSGVLAVKLIRADAVCTGKLEVAAAERAGEIATAIAEGRAQAYAESAGRASLIATMAQVDKADLMADLADMAERAQKERTVYRDRIRELPAPTCAPGAERMDVANRRIVGEPIP